MHSDPSHVCVGPALSPGSRHEHAWEDIIGIWFAMVSLQFQISKIQLYFEDQEEKLK